MALFACTRFYFARRDLRAHLLAPTCARRDASPAMSSLWATLQHRETPDLSQDFTLVGAVPVQSGKGPPCVGGWWVRGWKYERVGGDRGCVGAVNSDRRPRVLNSSCSLARLAAFGNAASAPAMLNLYWWSMARTRTNQHDPMAANRPSAGFEDLLRSDGSNPKANPKKEGLHSRRGSETSSVPAASLQHVASLASNRAGTMPTVQVLHCASGEDFLKFQNADNVVSEAALVNIFTTHFAPPGGEAPDLLFMPTSCGWTDPNWDEARGWGEDGWGEEPAPTPRLGYFGLASMPWGAFPSGTDLMAPLLTQSWPERMAVLSVEVPSYAASWDGTAGEATLRPMWRWGGTHPPAAALVIPYVSLPPPVTVPSLVDRPALVAFVGTIHTTTWGEQYATDLEPDIGRSPLRLRLYKECATQKWRGCIIISDLTSAHDSSFNMGMTLSRISREGAEGVYDSSQAMAKLSSMTAEAYAMARFTFCPWGDTLTRKSVFDAMMLGSIPVLFEDTLLAEYAHIGPIENMTVVVPLREMTPHGSGALSYLRALTADKVAQLHENVVRWRQRFHLPASEHSHVSGDAVDAIVLRLAKHFQGNSTLPQLPSQAILPSLSSGRARDMNGVAKLRSRRRRFKR